MKNLKVKIDFNLHEESKNQYAIIEFDSKKSLELRKDLENNGELLSDTCDQVLKINCVPYMPEIKNIKVIN